MGNRETPSTRDLKYKEIMDNFRNIKIGDIVISDNGRNGLTILLVTEVRKTRFKTECWCIYGTEDGPTFHRKSGLKVEGATPSCVRAFPYSEFLYRRAAAQRREGDIILRNN